MNGKKIKMLRELRNLSQNEVALGLGISQNTFSRIENNLSKLKATVAEKLAGIFGIALSDLLSKEIPVIAFPNNQIEQLLATKNYEIQTLKEEINYLRKQNEEFLKLIGKSPAEKRR